MNPLTHATVPLNICLDSRNAAERLRTTVDFTTLGVGGGGEIKAQSSSQRKVSSKALSLGWDPEG